MNLLAIRTSAQVLKKYLCRGLKMQPPNPVEQHPAASAPSLRYAQWHQNQWTSGNTSHLPSGIPSEALPTPPHQGRAITGTCMQ